MQSASLRCCPSTLLPLALLLASSALASAQTVINSLPYTVTSPGLYVLNQNLSSNQTTGNLITVATSNVTIDLQGHFLSGPVGNTTQDTLGIFAYNQNNLTIQNGTIAHCSQGIYLTGSGDSGINVDHRLSNLRVARCNNEGISVIRAPAARITNCQVSNIGGSSSGAALGIELGGLGATVTDTTVAVVTGYGIYLETGAIARVNQVAACTTGINGGLCQDNLATGCTTAFHAITDGGGNDSN